MYSRYALNEETYEETKKSSALLTKFKLGIIFCWYEPCWCDLIQHLPDARAHVLAEKC